MDTWDELMLLRMAWPAMHDDYRREEALKFLSPALYEAAIQRMSAPGGGLLLCLSPQYVTALMLLGVPAEQLGPILLAGEPEMRDEREPLVFVDLPHGAYRDIATQTDVYREDLPLYVTRHLFGPNVDFVPGWIGEHEQGVPEDMVTFVPPRASHVLDGNVLRLTYASFGDLAECACWFEMPGDPRLIVEVRVREGDTFTAVGAMPRGPGWGDLLAHVLPSRLLLDHPSAEVALEFVKNDLQQVLLRMHPLAQHALLDRLPELPATLRPTLRPARPE